MGAREGIVGSVFSIMAHDTLDQAIEPANDTPFGLVGFVQSKDLKPARKVADRLRAVVFN
jgi:aldehyde dehydrogenase (NAD+)